MLLALSLKMSRKRKVRVIVLLSDPFFFSLVFWPSSMGPTGWFRKGINPVGQEEKKPLMAITVTQWLIQTSHLHIICMSVYLWKYINYHCIHISPLIQPTVLPSRLP